MKRVAHHAALLLVGFLSLYVIPGLWNGAVSPAVSLRCIFIFTPPHIRGRFDDSGFYLTNLDYFRAAGMHT